MEPFIDRSDDRGDSRPAQRQLPAPDTRSGDPEPRTTRRALLALGGLLASGGTALAAPEEDRQPSPTDQARLKLAQKALETVRVNIGRDQFRPGERDPISIWARRRMEAKLDLSRTKADRVAAAREYLDEMKAVEQLVNQMSEAGQIDPLSRMDAEYRRLEAESWLEHEQQIA